MAVYYKWIKGCEPGSKLDSGLWSYISWGKAKKGTESETSQMPKLEVSTGKKDDNEKTDYGYFLTNNMPTPTIMKKWIFEDSLEVGNTDTDTVSTFHGYVNFSKDSAVSFNNRIYLYDIENGEKNNESSIWLSGDDELKAEGGFVVENYLIAHGDLIVKNDTNTANIETTGYCEAQYFNATSDKRAKENIKPATYNALELISKLPIYTFNYKNKTENITGILAQDLLEAQPEELDLVSNTNASGENNDYMSIKNDKLMFVLMKAIQEQQEQIKKLEEEIISLKKLV